MSDEQLSLEAMSNNDTIRRMWRHRHSGNRHWLASAFRRRRAILAEMILRGFEI
jgi:hypothetical protein